MLRFGLILTLLVLAVAPLAAQDEEPELVIPSLKEDTRFEDFLNANATAQLYLLNALAGDEVTISMTQLSDELDPFLMLLGSAGQIIAYDDDGGEEALASQISVTIPSTDTYFIMATAADLLRRDDPEMAQVDYEIKLAGLTPNVEVEGSDSGYIYYGSDLFDGDSFDGYSNAQEPIYYFTFEATEGQTAEVTLNSNEIDTLLHIFAPGGYRIAVDDDGGSETNSILRDVALAQDGLYLVFATSYTFHGAADGDYQGGNFVISLDLSEALDPPRNTSK